MPTLNECKNIDLVCPCLNCGTMIGIGKFPAVTRTPEEAIRMMMDHLLWVHSIKDLEELLERYLVGELEKLCQR